MAWEDELTMAVPARPDPAGQEPPDSANRHDPRACGWADVRQGLVDGTSLVVLTVAQLAGRDPGDAEALRIAELAVAALDRWGEIARRWVLDERVLADVDQRAYDRGVADCKAARCRLASVPDAG